MLSSSLSSRRHTDTRSRSARTANEPAAESRRCLRLPTRWRLLRLRYRYLGVRIEPRILSECALSDIWHYLPLRASRRVPQDACKQDAINARARGELAAAVRPSIFDSFHLYYHGRFPKLNRIDIVVVSMSPLSYSTPTPRFSKKYQRTPTMVELPFSNVPSDSSAFATGEYLPNK